jgi:hypothetical protein
LHIRSNHVARKTCRPWVAAVFLIQERLPFQHTTQLFSMEELRLLLDRVSGHLKLKTESGRCGRRPNPNWVSAASSAGRDAKAVSHPSAKLRTAVIPCSSWAEAGRARRWWHAPPILRTLPRQALYPGGLWLAGSRFWGPPIATWSRRWRKAPLQAQHIEPEIRDRGQRPFRCATGPRIFHG